jgi:hypothetical protein
MCWIYINSAYTNLIVDGDVRCIRKMKEKERYTHTHTQKKKILPQVPTTRRLFKRACHTRLQKTHVDYTYAYYYFTIIAASTRTEKKNTFFSGSN